MRPGLAVQSRDGDDLNRLTGEVVAAAIKVHRAIGPGLLQSVYEALLCRELTLRRVGVQTRVPHPVVYPGFAIESNALRLDLLAENAVIVDLKCVERVLKFHEARTLS